MELVDALSVGIRVTVLEFWPILHHVLIFHSLVINFPLFTVFLSLPCQQSNLSYNIILMISFLF